MNQKKVEIKIDESNNNNQHCSAPQLARTSLEYSLEVGRQDVLFDRLFPRFSHVSRASKLLLLLPSAILAGRLTVLPPRVLEQAGGNCPEMPLVPSIVLPGVGWLCVFVLQVKFLLGVVMWPGSSSRRGAMPGDRHSSPLSFCGLLMGCLFLLQVKLLPRGVMWPRL